MSEKMDSVSEWWNPTEGEKAPKDPIHNAQEDLSQIDWDIQFFKNQWIPIKAIREMKKFIPSIEYINMMKIIKHLLDKWHEIELLYQEFIESEILEGYLCSIKNERLSFYWTKKILDSNNEINIGKIYEIINRLNSYEWIWLTKKNIIYILQRMLDFYIRYKKEKWNKWSKKKWNDTDIEIFLMKLGKAKGSDSVYKNYNKIKNVNHINEIILSLKGNLYNIEQTRPKKIKKYDYFLKYYLDNIDYINYHILKIKKEKDIENVIVTSIDNKLEINKEMLKEIKQHRDKYSNCYFDTSKFENGYEIIWLHELLETELSTNNSNLSEIEDEISKIEDEIFYAQDVLSSTMPYSKFIKIIPQKNLESKIYTNH